MHRKRISLRQRWQGLSRKRKALATTPVALLALAGVAAAVAFWIGGFTGDIGVKETPTATVTLTSVTTGSVVKHGDLVCAPTVADGKLNPGISNALAGSSCEMEVNVKVTGNAGPYKIQGVSFADGIDVTFLGLSSVASPCGMQFVSGDTKGATVRFTIPEDAAPGSYPADADAGIRVVQSADYVAGNCTWETP